VLSVTKPRAFPSFKQWKQVSNTLSKKEKNTVSTATFLILVSIIFLIVGFVITNRIIIPAIGGEYTEALVGEPQYINPLYTSVNDVDTDLSRLIYSSLLEWDAEKGYVKDLAQEITIDDKKTTYTVKLRNDAKFHDGEKVRARDVLFTISAIQNPAYRSPLAANFQSTTISQVDDDTISFVLKKPIAQFEQFLTVGILPAHIWSEVLPQNAPLAALNLQPIGSGPYQFASFAKDKKGSIRSYTLKRSNDYYRDEPKIELLTFKFYADTISAMQALTNKNVEGVSIIPFEDLGSAKSNRSIKVVQPFIPQKMVLFFNQKSDTDLKKHSIRSAIARGINKDELVEKVLDTNARVIQGPVLPNKTGYHSKLETQNFDQEKAKSTLTEAGYSTQVKEIKAEEENSEETKEDTSDKKQLNLILTTVSSKEYTDVAELLKEQLKAVGINVEIKTVPSDRLFPEVIDTQNYELLLTSVLSDQDSDPYVFWHSSQTKQGGLNIAKYKSSSADKQLEKARSSIKTEDKEAALKKFQEILAKDLPAVFLYQSTYGFAVAKKVQGVDTQELSVPSDRFNKITSWYIKTKKALK
jgi:peptide/nickel transport system substrate-binding protein